jgi:CRP-like cAMP-binding protein
MSHLTGWLLEELLSERYQKTAAIQEYEKGQCIFRTGDPGDYVGVLLSGMIEIRKGQKSISVGETGSIFGEMGLIDRQPRAADVFASSYCKVMEIREGQFLSLLDKNPQFSLYLMRMLTERIRKQAET